MNKAMKNGKCLAGLMVLLFMLSLSACQLAQEDGGESQEQDRLIGVFVSRDRLVDDHAVEEALVVDGKGSVYLTQQAEEQGRFYAIKETKAEGENGEKEAAEVYAFPQLNGMFFYYIVDFSNPDVISALTGPNKGVSDGSVLYETTSHGGEVGEQTQYHLKKVEMKGTFYGVIGEDNPVFYAHPIYLTPEGKAYVVDGGPGISMGSEGGESVSLTGSETSKITVGNRTEEYMITYHAEFALKNIPQCVRVLQMSREGRVLDRRTFLPGQAPEAITLLEETAYLVVETEETTLTGEHRTDRVAINQGEETMTTWYPLDNGFFTNQITNLYWR